MVMAKNEMGIGIRRHFTEPGVDPYDTVEWDRREARIPNYKDGTDAFFQPDVEFPLTWSQNATNIVAQKYFRGTLGTPEREWSLKQVIDRVVDTITRWGERDGYFVDDDEADAFRDELKYVLLHQRAAFNSPVWFNIGVNGVPQQASACQPYDALVSTPEGLIPIGKLVDDNAVGTKVFDAHGITKVVAVKHNGRKEVLRIHTKAGITLDVTPDHLVWRSTGGEQGLFTEAGTLRPGDRLEWHDVDPLGDAVLTPAIERIESLGEMDVYDVQTESGEYLSNHVRVHNCFILAVDDTMDAILNWYREEGIIFKGGSGSGINLSGIRSSMEPLQGGGTASGPVSFMRGADASAGTIKCLHADTPIVTDTGVVPIRDAEPGARVLTRFGYQPITAVHDNGVRPLVRVRTSLGDEILCTPEHRFRVRGRDGESWRLAGELRPDDHLIIELSAGQRGSLQPLDRVAPGHHREVEHDLPTTLDEPFAMWLGWILGDGSVTSRPSAKFVAVQIGDGDPEIEGRYKSLTRAVFGKGIHFYSSRHDDKPDASASVRFASGQVIRFLEANDLRKTDCRDVRIPRAIQSSPAAVRAAFLSGLFEADGHVGNGYPWLSTVSHGLALDVHRLLLSLGIPSWIGRIEDRRAAHGDAPMHTVRIVGGEGVRRFAKLIGFVSERKHQALEAAVARKAVSPYETQWVLPHVIDDLNRIWEATNDQRLRRALAPYCRFAKPQGMSLLRARALLRRFPHELSVSRLADFIEGEEFYVTATVEPAGEAPTFDLTVDKVHEYLVNSLVTHNSGGKTRRAAKMVILNSDHPDIEEFIWCKAREERKARALSEAGFDMDLDGRDSHSIQYQNANNSVRVTDEFMQAVVDDADWELRSVKTGEAIRTMKARDLMRQISEATWDCADPGMQFDTTINRWHTAANTGRINASNPCSEYMHLDNSACNLASINLLKFLDLDGDYFDVDGYKHTVEVVFTAQEILVGNADYPTEKIAETSRQFRQLGLGYANLGALLMAMGVPYDSPAGREWAGALTALMTGHAYATSARTAARMGPFAGYAANEEPMLNVLRMHRAEVAKIDEELVPVDVLSAAQRAWDDAVETAEVHGVRNSQSSVLAPTGTIGLMMDCDTTGIEPDLALTKAKKLVGGGTMLIVNQTVPRALRRLGYSDEQVDAIIQYIDEHKSIIGAPAFNPEHLPVFACSMGDNSIHYMGHVTMMGAVQPFISGAISKTVNMPEEATVEDVEGLHIEAWRLGLKAVAIYRDNCKVGQPLATQKKAGADDDNPLAEEVGRVVEHIITVKDPVRQKLPRKRTSKTFSFRVADCHGYVTIGEFEDGRPGELFLKVAKQGSTLAGMMDGFAIAVSLGLQFGVPLRTFVEKFTNVRWEPAGMTDDPDIRFATSILDYIFRRLAVEYLPKDEREEIGVLTVHERMQPTLPGVEEAATVSDPGVHVLPLDDQAPSAAMNPPAASIAAASVDGETVICHVCGDIMQRAGTCHACPSCGATSGCS
jgi:ribonucleoside-diphosphate reductase alpha chain